MTTGQVSSKPSSFVSKLEEYSKDKNQAVLAKLRRGLRRAPSEAKEMWPYVIPFVSNINNSRDVERHFLLASLFATCPYVAGHLSMGGLFRSLEPEVGKRQESLERRFKALLSSNWSELPIHLATAVRLANAKQKEFSISYELLFKDLKQWEHPKRTVQLRWARDYWTDTVSSESNESNETKGQ